MEAKIGGPQQPVKRVYSVWALPPENVTERVKKVMAGLRSEFGGPEFEPHITVVGAITLTEEDALNKFRAACEGLKAYNTTVEKVATGTFFYQCVYLLLHPTAEGSPKPAIWIASDPELRLRNLDHRWHPVERFLVALGANAYMPHLSLLYADISDEEKKKAQERAKSLDESISSLSFQISRLGLYETDTEDKTLKSWRKVAESNLGAN